MWIRLDLITYVEILVQLNQGFNVVEGVTGRWDCFRHLPGPPLIGVKVKFPVAL